MCSFIVLVSEIPASVSLIVYFMQILESLINKQDSKVQEGKIVHKEKIEDVLIFPYLLPTFLRLYILL